VGVSSRFESKLTEGPLFINLAVLPELGLHFRMIPQQVHRNHREAAAGEGEGVARVQCGRRELSELNLPLPGMYAPCEPKALLNVPPKRLAPTSLRSDPRLPRPLGTEHCHRVGVVQPRYNLRRAPSPQDRPAKVRERQTWETLHRWQPVASVQAQVWLEFLFQIFRIAWAKV